MKKKISQFKQEAKKDIGKLSNLTQKAIQEFPQPAISANVQININSEQEIIFKEKIKLDDLLGIKDQFRTFLLGGNQNFVNLFFLNKKYLFVYQVESNLNPASDYCSSYTTKEFDTNEDKLIPVKTIKTNTDYKIKILQVEDSKHNNYVLKRCWIPINMGPWTFDEFTDLTIFVSEKYTEYAITKLYNACPHSAKPAGYHIVHLTNQATKQMMLVTEMLSVFAGNPLSDIFPITDSGIILEYFIKILQSGNFLEAYKIEDRKSVV